MTQVFAAVNHRLSEEYDKIELPDQSTKDRYVIFILETYSFDDFVRLLRDAIYLKQQFSGLKDVNASASMLEAVVKEKPVASTSGSQINRAGSQSPVTSVAPEASSSPPPTQPSVHKSANERLRSMFRRTSTAPMSETAASASSPVPEKPSPPLTDKPLQEEPINGFHSPTPPPIPKKPSLGDSIVRSLSPGSPGPSSPLDGRPRSPRVLEKALPIPVPLLDADGNIVDHPDSPRPSGEGKDLEEEEE
jgi:vacuolar protein sorting-associated protein 54